MTETEFLVLAQATMRRIEAELESAAEGADCDIESTISGNVLEIEFVDRGTKIIVNSQTPMQQIWVAATSGGFHFGYESGRWIDTRDGTELFAALSRLVSTQAGISLKLRA